jgi:Fe-S-cluster containining protein
MASMSICVGCALCCDGTLFHATDLVADDNRIPLAEHQAVFVTDTTSDRFLQPCPAVTDRCCNIYDTRPTMCRAYTCDLLTAVEDGDVDEATAQQVIEQAIQLRDRVRPALEALTQRRPSVADLMPTATNTSAPPLRRLTGRSIPGLRNALATRVAGVTQDDLPAEVRTLLHDTDELMELLRDHFGLGR